MPIKNILKRMKKSIHGLQVGQVLTVKGSCDSPAWLWHQQVSINHVIHDLPEKVSITVGCRKLSGLL